MFKKSFVWKLIVGIFTLSLYAHLAEARGSGATILTVILVVVLVVVAVVFTAGIGLGAGGFLTTSGWLTTTVGGVVTHAAAWYGVAAGIAATIGLTGMTTGAVQCRLGQDNAFFTGCNSQTGSWGGQEAAAGSPVLNNESYSAACNSISLTYDISGANQYAIYRTAAGETNSSLITQGSASGLSKITYTDTAVATHATYQYVLVMTDSSGQQSQYPPINAYTNCLPSCTFGADKNQVSYPAQIILSWNCQEATSCSITPGVGSVSATSGQTTLTPTEDTNYILTCQNIDGSTSFSSSVDVVNPHIKEINP